MNFRAYDRFSPQGPIIPRAALLWCVIRGTDILTTLTAQDNWIVKVKYVITTTGRYRACDCTSSQRRGQLRKKKINTCGYVL